MNEKQSCNERMVWPSSVRGEVWWVLRGNQEKLLEGLIILLNTLYAI